MLACNLESSVLAEHIQDYVVLNVSGQLIGVVGYITERTAYLTNPGTYVLAFAHLKSFLKLNLV